jgi:hypothetical protein
VSATLKLTAFALLLALLFGAGALAGDLSGPERQAPAVAAKSPADPSAEPHTETASSSTETTGGHGGGGAAEQANHPVRGLAVAENGLRVVVEDPELRRGRSEKLTFRIVEQSGATVRDFDVEHEKRMHLIVARRDLTGFQHLHPKQADDGSWTTMLRLDDAGSYRLFADFARNGKSYTLASDLRVDGAADLKPLPASRTAAVSDGGYDVRVDADRARPDQEAALRFTITKDGHTVHTEPYLGAGGHLVALREGDLAFLHVHPTEHGHNDAKTTGEHDDSIGFEATFPTEGRYRLFLQFKHEGRVQTVAFTQEVK